LSPADKPYVRRLTTLLHRQQRIVTALQQRGAGTEQRRAMRGLLKELRELQLAIWNSLAARPRSTLLAIAHQVDRLAEQWGVVASELGERRADAELTGAA
jgi:hypothetical protein